MLTTLASQPVGVRRSLHSRGSTGTLGFAAVLSAAINQRRVNDYAQPIYIRG